MSKNPVDISSIKAILFDLGGVLLNIDYQLTEKAFVDLGVVNFAEIYSQAKQSTLFDDFEVGKIDESLFLNQLSNYLTTSHSHYELRKAWNAMLLDYPSERIEMLRSLQSNFNVFLLSNTNEIHYKAFNELFEKEYQFDFSSLFDKAYYSHTMGMRKPNSNVFLRILEEQSLLPHEVIFIDDSIQHVEGAEKLGINSFVLEKGREVSDLLASIGILT